MTHSQGHRVNLCGKTTTFAESSHQLFIPINQLIVVDRNVHSFTFSIVVFPAIR